MTFGEKLSKERKLNNYTQEQLADILSVSRQTISKWELDVAYPETDKLVKLGELFDCSMDYLLKENVEDKGEKDFSKNDKSLLKEKNRCRIKKALKIGGIVFGILLLMDILSFVVYVSVCGLPN